LTAANGLPYDGEVSAAVKFFDVASDGTAIDTEDLGAVDVVSGVFRVTMAALADVAASNDDIWLEFWIDGGALSPRQKVNSNVFAHRAGDAAMLGGVDAAEYVTAEDTIPLEALPTDAIGHVSNNSINNEFFDVSWEWTSGPKDILDFPGLGAQASITTSETEGSYITSVVIYTTFTLTANSKLTMVLVPPSGSGVGPITLISSANTINNGSHANSWTVGNMPALGDLIGKEVAGDWVLTITDTSDELLGAAKVGELTGLEVDNDVVRADEIGINGKLSVKGSIEAGGPVTMGWTDAACTALNEGAVRYNATTKQFEGCNGSGWLAMGRGKGSMYRWVTWNNYHPHTGWYAGNNSNVFGGVAPSNWCDGNYRGTHLSSNFDVLRAFFVNSGPPIEGKLKNALVSAKTTTYGDSTDGMFTAVLFRIKNSTQSNINWTVHWYATSFPSWSERSSISVNGADTWNNGGDTNAQSPTSHGLTIPANRTSTVVFIASSYNSSWNNSRNHFLAFYNDSLVLPAGLEYVDDFDTKPNGWDN
jgi:hypothetical protein